ncbi:MAG: hypothetical protein Q8R02_15605 [Hyphomonadaceae bacterium]|nr:hypothetical protein [Hyphomonadaceae bacterium]
MTQAETAPARQGSNKLLNTIFTAAWIAILLGLLVQIGVFSAKIGAGAKLPLIQLMVDIANGVTWSVIVCGGVAIGIVAAKSVPQLMGLLGLICAPVAFAAAKGTQRGVAWMAGQPMDQINALTYQIATVKALEYAALGFVLGMVIRTPRSTLTNHTLIGLGFGVLFAALIVWLNMQSMANGAPLPPPRLWATVVNEFIFPIGCSLVIFAVAKLSDQASARERIVAGS